MPRCIQCDIDGHEHCSHIQDSVPFGVNDDDFARNNRVFCDFLHRGIVGAESGPAMALTPAPESQSESA